MDDAKPSAKRTNSLGRAADDCFSCQKLTPPSRCDRQRPRCNVCTEAGKVCSGYYQEIQWQGGASRANWRTKRRVSTDRQFPTLQSLTERPPEIKEESGPPDQGGLRAIRPNRAPSGSQQTFKFVTESVERAYIDRSFAASTISTSRKRPKTSSDDADAENLARDAGVTNAEEISRDSPAAFSRNRAYYQENQASTSQSYPPFQSVQEHSRFAQDSQQWHERQRSLSISTAMAALDSQGRSDQSTRATAQHTTSGRPAAYIPSIYGSRSDSNLSNRSAQSARSNQSWHEIVGSPAARKEAQDPSPTPPHPKGEP